MHTRAPARNVAMRRQNFSTFSYSDVLQQGLSSLSYAQDLEPCAPSSTATSKEERKVCCFVPWCAIVTLSFRKKMLGRIVCTVIQLGLMQRFQNFKLISLFSFFFIFLVFHFVRFWTGRQLFNNMPRTHGGGHRYGQLGQDRFPFFFFFFGRKTSEICAESTTFDFFFSLLFFKLFQKVGWDHATRVYIQEMKQHIIHSDFQSTDSKTQK